jgi:hypothetical protein
LRFSRQRERVQSTWVNRAATRIEKSKHTLSFGTSTYTEMSIFSLASDNTASSQYCHCLVEEVEVKSKVPGISRLSEHLRRADAQTEKQPTQDRRRAPCFSSFLSSVGYSFLCAHYNSSVKSPPPTTPTPSKWLLPPYVIEQSKPLCCSLRKDSRLRLCEM